MRPLLLLLALVTAGACAAPLTPAQNATLQRISADSMRGHLSFIASDLLEGRKTPSRGLDLAAEYLAAQYRRAGLEPLGDDDYFQTANWDFVEPDVAGFALALQAGGTRVDLPSGMTSFAPGFGVDLKAAAVLKVQGDDLAPLEALGEAVRGRIVMLEPKVFKPASMEEYQAMLAHRAAMLARLEKLQPALVLAIERSRASGNAGGKGMLVDPEQPKQSALPFLTVHGEMAARFYDGLPAGAGNASVDARVRPPKSKPVKLRNVAAILPGSDPVLKDSFIILSAHYDHLGVNLDMPGDNIFNGANDNGSGTVSVIEIASALAASGKPPKRSIVFLNLFGEELGMLGSQYYGRHPLVPLSRTVANLNLEQLGRTDAADGDMTGRAAVTGFGYSSMPQTLVKAGKLTGLDVYGDAKLGEQYFNQSDNAALAKVGVPAHTLSVAYAFPDYHKAGDHWQEIDYDNMAKVSRTIALGLLMMANDKDVPKWNAAHPATAPYIKAAKALVK